jgi:hypothetical protein
MVMLLKSGVSPRLSLLRLSQGKQGDHVGAGAIN